MAYIIDAAQALELLKKSEKMGGHTFEYHVGLTNQEMMDRLRGPNNAKHGEISWFTSFKTKYDAANALRQAFKNMDVRLAQAIAQQGRVLRTDQPFRVRLAFVDRVREVETDLVSLRLAASPIEEEGKGFFIRTFYPRPPQMIQPLTG